VTSDDDFFDKQMHDVRAFGESDEIDPVEIQPRDRDTSSVPDAPRLLAGVGESEALQLVPRGAGVEASVPSLGRRVLRRLRQGEPSPERIIDLHGKKRGTARRHLDDGVALALAAGERVLVVVHGRGLHSEDGAPILKTLVPEWLSTPPLRAHVLAFTPAPARDGGDGALYVLLRRLR
jgi:DNA-nicking Smr family endonuclease